MSQASFISKKKNRLYLLTTDLWSRTVDDQSASMVQALALDMVDVVQVLVWHSSDFDDQ